MRQGTMHFGEKNTPSLCDGLNTLVGMNRVKIIDACVFFIPGLKNRYMCSAVIVGMNASAERTGANGHLQFWVPYPIPRKGANIFFR